MLLKYIDNMKLFQQSTYTLEFEVNCLPSKLKAEEIGLWLKVRKKWLTVKICMYINVQSKINWLSTFPFPFTSNSLKQALKCHQVLLEENAHVYLCSRSQRSETMKKKSQQPERQHAKHGLVVFCHAACYDNSIYDTCSLSCHTKSQAPFSEYVIQNSMDLCFFAGFQGLYGPSPITTLRSFRKALFTLQSPSQSLLIDSPLAPYLGINPSLSMFQVALLQKFVSCLSRNLDRFIATYPNLVCFLKS